MALGNILRESCIKQNTCLNHMKKLGQDYYMEILIEMKLNIWFNPVKATIPGKIYLWL